MLKIVFLLLVLQNTSFGQSTCRSVLYASEKKTAVPAKFRTALKYSPYIYEGPIARGIEIEANLPESAKRADVALAVIEGLYREFESYNAKESNSKYSMSLRIQSKYGETHIFSPDEFLKTSTLSDGWRIIANRGNIDEIWTVVPDHTAATSYNNDVEITSPILRSPEDMIRFTNIILSTQSKLGLTSSKAAGIHTHIDFPKARAQEVALLYWVFSRIETQMKKKLGVKPNTPRQHYIRPLPLAEKVISDEILSLSFSDFMAKMEQIAFSNLNGIFNQAKYHSLNILSLTKYGTVEFRLFPSVFDGSAINNYANFSAQLVRAVREKDPDLLNLVFRHEQDMEIPLHELESTIGIKLISL